MSPVPLATLPPPDHGEAYSNDDIPLVSICYCPIQSPITMVPPFGLSSYRPKGLMIRSKKRTFHSAPTSTNKKCLYKGKVPVTPSSLIHVDSSPMGSPAPSSLSSVQTTPSLYKHEARLLVIGKEQYFATKVVLRVRAIH